MIVTHIVIPSTETIALILYSPVTGMGVRVVKELLTPNWPSTLFCKDSSRCVLCLQLRGTFKQGTSWNLTSLLSHIVFVTPVPVCTIYYIKLWRPFVCLSVCLSVCLYPLFSDTTVGPNLACRERGREESFTLYTLVLQMKSIWTGISAISNI